MLWTIVDLINQSTLLTFCFTFVISFTIGYYATLLINKWFQCNPVFTLVFVSIIVATVATLKYTFSPSRVPAYFVKSYKLTYSLLFENFVRGLTLVDNIQNINLRLQHAIQQRSMRRIARAQRRALRQLQAWVGDDFVFEEQLDINPDPEEVEQVPELDEVEQSEVVTLYQPNFAAPAA
jgi:hypothetical protein